MWRGSEKAGLLRPVGLSPKELNTPSAIQPPKESSAEQLAEQIEDLLIQKEQLLDEMRELRDVEDFVGKEDAITNYLGEVARIENQVKELTQKRKNILPKKRFKLW